MGANFSLARKNLILEFTKGLVMTMDEARHGL
jgi:hypothetical protein